METTPAKSGMSFGVKLFIAIVVVATISVGGYVAYNKFLKPSSPSPDPNKPDGKGSDSKPTDKSTESKPATDKSSGETDASKGAGGGGGGAGEGDGKTFPKVGGGSASLGIGRATKIQKGVKGNAATYAQQALNKLGAALDVDGDFGTKSAASLKKITGKTSMTLGELGDFAKSKGTDNVFGIQLY